MLTKTIWRVDAGSIARRARFADALAVAARASACALLVGVFFGRTAARTTREYCLPPGSSAGLPSLHDDAVPAELEAARLEGGDRQGLQQRLTVDPEVRDGLAFARGVVVGQEGEIGGGEV